MTVPLADLTGYLDAYLRIAEVRDSPNAVNGLQVENEGTVTRLAAAVDACQVTIERAAQLGADLLLVHHGLFWRGLEPLTGRHGRRLRTLVRRGIAVYSAHLPLDLHPEVGNNTVLAQQLGLSQLTPFGEHEGQAVGTSGTADVDLSVLVQRVREVLEVEPRVIAAGPTRVGRVGVVTGDAGGMVGEAHRAGLDAFITGEGRHHTFFDAEEWRVNVVYAGHYATETVGVKALAHHLSERFGLPWAFIDHPTGL